MVYFSNVNLSVWFAVICALFVAEAMDGLAAGYVVADDAVD